MWATVNRFRGNDSEVKPIETTKGNTLFKIAEIYEINNYNRLWKQTAKCKGCKIFEKEK